MILILLSRLVRQSSLLLTIQLRIGLFLEYLSNSKMIRGKVNMRNPYELSGNPSGHVTYFTLPAVMWVLTDLSQTLACNPSNFMNCWRQLVSGYSSYAFSMWNRLTKSRSRCLEDVVTGHSPRGSNPYHETYQTSLILSGSSCRVKPRNFHGVRAQIFLDFFSWNFLWDFPQNYSHNLSETPRGIFFFWCSPGIFHWFPLEVFRGIRVNAVFLF